MNIKIIGKERICKIWEKKICSHMQHHDQPPQKRFHWSTSFQRHKLQLFSITASLNLSSTTHE